MTYRPYRHLLATTLAVMLAACGGGGGSSPEVVSGGSIGSGGGDGSGGSSGSGGGSGSGSGDAGDTGAGISGSGKAVGVITQFGSIFVNGIEYDTSDAVIVVNGVLATEDDLGVGMVVFIQGTVNEDGVTGVAEVVIVDDNLKGPISEITSATDESGALLDARQITVLGIDVVIERTGTVFEDTTFESLSAGDFVEIYGFAESGNNIRATRVERENFVAGVTKVEVYGAVNALDTTAETFMLGSYTVNYSAAVFDDIDESTFADGLLVEVKGTLASADALAIDATKIEPTGIDGGDAEDNGEVDVDTSFGDDDEFTTEGTISSYDPAANTFVINGTAVDASSAELVPGNLILEDGLIVQVEGTFSGDVLIAEEIKSRRGRIEIEARISGLDEANQSITLNLGVGVLDVAITPQTLMDDDRDSRDERFNFEDLMVGDFLEIEAMDVDGALIATRVDREDEDEDEEEISLQAPVDEFVAEESITLLGLQFAVDSETEYESIGGADVPATAFFAQISSGFLVKLEDEDPLDGIADELEFEDPSRPDGGYEFDDDDDDDDSGSDDESCEVASDDSDDDSDSSDSSDSSGGSDSSDGSGGTNDGADDTSSDDDDDDDDDENSDSDCSP